MSTFLCSVVCGVVGAGIFGAVAHYGISADLNIDKEVTWPFVWLSAGVGFITGALVGDPLAWVLLLVHSLESSHEPGRRKAHH